MQLLATTSTNLVLRPNLPDPANGEQSEYGHSWVVLIFYQLSAEFKDNDLSNHAHQTPTMI